MNIKFQNLLNTNEGSKPRQKRKQNNEIESTMEDCTYKDDIKIFQTYPGDDNDHKIQKERAESKLTQDADSVKVGQGLVSSNN